MERTDIDEELLEVKYILKSLDIEYDIDIYEDYFILKIYPYVKGDSIVILKFIYPNNSDETEEIVMIIIERVLRAYYDFRRDIAKMVLEVVGKESFRPYIGGKKGMIEELMELQRRLDSSNEWDPELNEDICRLAGPEYLEAYQNATGDDFEQVVEAACKSLGLKL